MGNAFQHIEVLKRNRNKRHQYGQFFVEGVRPIQRLVDNRWPVHSVWSNRRRRLSRWATSILLESGAEYHYELEPELMQALSDREEPSELLLVAGIQQSRLADIPTGDELLAVILDRPTSPGNLGTVVRTADAMGASAVVISGHAADPFDPRAIRASMGSLFAVPVVQAEGPDEVGRWLAGSAAAVMGTDSAGELPLPSADLRGPTVLVVGNEAGGISHGFRQLCAGLIRVPMLGSADSLNMAVATSIVLYEAARQRAAAARAREPAT